MSLLDYIHLGSSLSLRGFARMGSTLSLNDYAHFGSTLSLRSYGRMGSTLSVKERVHTYDFVSEGHAFFHYASGGFIGASQASFSDMFTSMAEIHGSLLASGGAVFGSRLGTEVKLDGSSGTFRMRFDGLYHQVAFWSDYERRLSFGTMDDGFSTGGKLHGEWTADTPFMISGLYQSQLNMQAYIDGTMGAMHFSSQDGVVIKTQTPDQASTSSFTSKITAALTGPSVLHGAWMVDDMISTSDRRLKTNIRSLTESIADHSPIAAASKREDGDGRERQASRSDPAWVLRQLRPVSFRFLEGHEAKGTDRYGFIAQELREVMPGLVRSIKSKKLGESFGVNYQDLLALAVAAQQTQQDEASELRAMIVKLETTLNEVLASIGPRVREQAARHDLLDGVTL